LLELVRPYLTLLAASQLGNRLAVKADPNDVVQEAMLQALRKFHTFAGSTLGEFVAWMEAVLASRVEKLVRRYFGTARRDLRLERELAAGFAESSRMLCELSIDPRANPSGVVADREQAVRVAAAVQTLPDDQRQVIVLRHMDGLTFPQIGERMGRSADAATQLWVRAVRGLRDALGEHP
jgi:RNA polymerase sigma-70 factor (ECF subfamily)